MAFHPELARISVLEITRTCSPTLHRDVQQIIPRERHKPGVTEPAGQQV
jgi:hypothetical protein